MIKLSSHESSLLSLITSMMSNNNNELTLVVVVTVSVVTLAILRFMLSSKQRLPPGPISLPIVGYLPFLSRDLHKQVTTMSQKYGPILKFYVGSNLFVVINTPDLVKVLLRDQDEVFSHRNPTVAGSTMSYGGHDIVWSNGPTWINNRRLLVQEVLSNKNLQACRHFRRDEVRKTIKNVFNKLGTPVNIKETAYLTEANVIRRMVWDNSSDFKDENLASELMTMSNNILLLMGKPNMSDFFPSIAWLDIQGVKRDMKKNVQKFDETFATIIEDRIKSNSSKNDSSHDHNADEGKKDFIQTLLDLKVDRTVIKAILMDVITGGTETTTTLIEWAMAQIIKNDMVRKRIQEELEEVVGVNNIVEEYHLPKLQYLDATIKETFRLHPPGPFLIPRSPTKDCTVGGYTIPKGCFVFINTWSLHLDPRYWDKPLEFNPDRFLENKFDFKGNSYKYIPFGAGRRSCPGISLAEKMEMYILASLLHSFDWSLPEGAKHDFSDKYEMALKKKIPLIAIPSQRLPDVSLYM